MSWTSWTRFLTSTKFSHPGRLQKAMRAPEFAFTRSIQTTSRVTRMTLLSSHGCSVGLLGQRRLLSGIPRRRPFDPRFFSSNSSEATRLTARLPVLSPPPVAMWLLGSSALVFAVIVVGGVTRLTESGLSITEWRPVSGVLPPLSQGEWEEEFEKYKRTPEFKMCVALSRCRSMS